MRIPGSERAVIAEAKLRDYLLDPAHPVGRTKALFFVRLGYLRESWHMLAKDLRDQHLSLDSAVEEESPFGKVYVIVAPLAGPSGTRNVRSVWQIDAGTDFPRLISAYPGGER